ncbi:MAG: BlaI/MecI/CopY family transcriptional regulator [Deltaproteobacteria bacterium]|nr:BlaI/MecI/CopY family transcriptional regulator [Deltaproteobacteria bacterium]MBW2500391.1 BlaI/MecI/CopY family transcriptional regulator [Deltaproteobacteria bacterium]
MSEPAPIRVGYLEREVLEWLWNRASGDVKAAHQALGLHRKLAVSTVHSTLERLVRKGLAERTKRGRAYEYRAVFTRSDWVHASLALALEAIPKDDPGLLLASFVDIAERVDASGLRELERLVRERRLERSDAQEDA